ncbi:lycopene cyclase (CrtL-type) [Pseudonocardia sediminis]|uniref:Lycopene cyclase (CrtL-type) n=1 Tax=Pseudonocardia sediminis TaxID=1397368 RepID=A0A4Q7UYU1_PSEST|nr:lycopene cyclase family protein [Pseudonocardia sediminis]RZT86258.1 lycopene cyclase (CrtL-type) [Pseudonocardia sediminis]
MTRISRAEPDRGGPAGPASGSADVVVLGGGPAGRALAGECAARGLRTTLVDPAPDRPWRNTYGAWAADLPPGVPDSAIGSRSRARMFGTGEHTVEGTYLVLDTAGLRAHLDAGLGEVRVLAGRVHEVDAQPAHTVTLADGRVLTAGVVVDATGAPSTLRPSRPGPAVEQTAYGVVVPEAVAAPLVGPGEAVFMDWRAHHGHTGWPTFLYAVPYGDGTVLLEETSLARRPGLPLSELRGRLHTRLLRHGVRVPDGAPVEKVRFPVDEPRAPAHPVAFGAATPLVHPASGFSVATALTLAPAVADALAAHLPGSPTAATTAAAAVLWPAPARTVHRLRHLGLRTVLDLPPGLVPAFFDAFFRLPQRDRAAFLSGRDDLAGTVRAMGALSLTATAPVRLRMLRSAVRPSRLVTLDE